jgi:hypothetical protein
VLPDFYSGDATRRSGRFSEGFLLRRLQVVQHKEKNYSNSRLGFSFLFLFNFTEASVPLYQWVKTPVKLPSSGTTSVVPCCTAVPTLTYHFGFRGTSHFPLYRGVNAAVPN